MRRGAWDVERPRRRHGHQRRVRRRCASRRSCPASSASASRCGPTTTSSRSPRCARTTTGTSRRGAARIPVASSRTRSRTCAIPQVAADEIRRNAARGFKARHVLGGARQARAADDPLRLLGSVLRRVRGDRDRRCACTSGRRARRRRRRPTRRPRSRRCCSARTACTARSTGSTRRSRCASRTSRSACRRAASAGWPGIIDRLDHCYKYQLGYLPTWRDVDAHAERGAAPQLLVLRARRRRRACTMRHRIGVDHILVESDYPHADSSWPDTQPVLKGSSRPCPWMSSGRSAGRTASSCSATWRR